MSIVERRKIVLRSETHRQFVGSLVATLPPGCVVTIDPPRRSLDQNARFHAMLTEVARSGMEWGGCQRTIDEWKVIFVSAHAVATKRPGELVEGIEGEAVMLRESTAMMSKDRLGSLMDYMEAWCASHCIMLRDPVEQ